MIAKAIINRGEVNERAEEKRESKKKKKKRNLQSLCQFDKRNRRKIKYKDNL